MMKPISLSMMIALVALISGASADLRSAEAEIIATTENWSYAVTKASNAALVTQQFCADGLLWGTVDGTVRTRHNPDATKDIRAYFKWFAEQVPNQDVDFVHNVAQVTDNVYVNNADAHWTWEGNSGLDARMTFMFRRSGNPMHTNGFCIFQLHSSAQPVCDPEDPNTGYTCALQASDRKINDERRGGVTGATKKRHLRSRVARVAAGALVAKALVGRKLQDGGISTVYTCNDPASRFDKPDEILAHSEWTARDGRKGTCKKGWSCTETGGKASADELCKRCRWYRSYGGTNHIECA